MYPLGGGQGCFNTNAMSGTMMVDEINPCQRSICGSLSPVMLGWTRQRQRPPLSMPRNVVMLPRDSAVVKSAAHTMQSAVHY